VLARAGFGNHPLLAHALSQQTLAERVVDLVRASVQQVLALEVDSCAAKHFGQPLAKVERCGAAGKVDEERREFGLKSGIGFGNFVFALELDQRRHEHLRHVAPAVDAESAGPRFGGTCRENDGRHKELLLSCPRKGEPSSVQE
jgi:hypothetical protein